jgi:hypothetical protein
MRTKKEACRLIIMMVCLPIILYKMLKCENRITSMQDTKTKKHDNRLNLRNVSTSSNSIESGTNFQTVFIMYSSLTKASSMYCVCPSVLCLSSLTRREEAQEEERSGVSMDTS